MNPPPLGSVITVKHDGCYSTGVLKRPVFWRHKEEGHSNSGATPTWNDEMAHKYFFDHPATKLDVADVNDWYKLTREEVYKHGGENTL